MNRIEIACDELKRAQEHLVLASTEVITYAGSGLVPLQESMRVRDHIARLKTAIALTEEKLSQ